MSLNRVLDLIPDAISYKSHKNFYYTLYIGRQPPPHKIYTVNSVQPTTTISLKDIGVTKRQIKNCHLQN